MYKLSLITLLALFIIGSSCNKEEVSKTLSLEELSGAWNDQLAEGVLFFAGKRYNFEFTADSFYLRRHVFSDAITIGAKCPSNRTEIISGVYTILPDHYLTFKGTYDEILDTEGELVCLDNIGNNYIWSPKYFYDGNIILLNPDAEYPIKLVR